MRRPFPWLLAGAYALVLTGLGAWRFAVHRNFVDFGIFEQTVGSAFGCFCNTVEGSHWAFHFSPILYLAGALLAVWRSPLALVALQAVACALVIPPVYALIESRAGSAQARWGAVIAALYPPLSGLAFGDFHENGLAPAAIVWMLWAFDADYLFAAVSAAVLAIAVKEDQAIFVGVAAAVTAWRLRGTRRGRCAALVAAAGIVAVGAFFLVIQPGAHTVAGWSPARFYAWRAQDVAALFPQGLLARCGFFALAFAPLGFLPLRSRMMWLCVLPLAEVLLSRMSTTYTLGTHYSGAWIGYVLAAFAFAFRVLPERVNVRASWICAALCILEFAVANPMHTGLNLRALQARDAALDRLLARVPDGAAVATQEEAFSKLALRDPNATVLPDDPTRALRAEYVLIDRDFPDSPRLAEYGATFDAGVRSGAYTRIASDGGAELYRKAAILAPSVPGH